MKNRMKPSYGNCDTHVFLGSNSQKTVEYFSKALGEKTIFRQSESINKDKDDWKQGKSVSEQNMARALLTPDELRRLDVDECIIYEKGLKPIKASKYYYYKYPTERMIKPYAVDHNTREDIDRGKWRKYNPYNPYVDEENTPKQNTKIEQLDDLFKDDEQTETKKEETLKTNTNPEVKLQPQSLDDLFDDMPIGLPMEPEVEKTKEPEKTEVDIQKELEAKFDELFGSLNDED